MARQNRQNLSSAGDFFASAAQARQAAMSSEFASARLPSPGAPGLAPEQRERMIQAAREVLECHRVLHRGGLTLISDIMRAGQAAPAPFEHYPPDDVIDHAHHAQYYYHAHRSEEEHGHFHCFARILNPAGEGWVPVHLGAISMTHEGLPRALFATNRWVTEEHWLPAEDTIALLDRFVIDHAAPSWPVNRWVTAMLVLFRPHFEALLRQRERIVEAFQHQHPEVNALDDQELEVTGQIVIDIRAWLAELANA
jgi:hypothetical protein